MNRVYKLVWSKTKNMYVAACEYAKSHAKVSIGSKISRAVVAGVLLSLLSGGIAMPVWADAVNITSPDNENPNTVTDDSTIVVGKDNNLTGGEHVVVGTGNDFSSISRTPYDIVAFGNSNSFAYSDSPYVTGTIVVGNGNQVAEGSVSIGYNVNNNPGNDYFSGTPGSFTVAIGYDSTAEGERSVSLGNSSYTGGEKSVAVGNAAYAIGKGSVAVGNFSQTNNDDSIAIGNNSVTDYSDSVAIGSSATTKDYESIAVGSSATTTSSNSVSLGYSATTNSSYSIALGHSSVVDSYAGTALGYEANVSGENSVALGSYSVANEDFTVSVGDSTYDLTRRITNVSDGVADTDVATVKQLKNYDNQKVLAGNNIHVVESTDANGVKQFTVSAVVDSSNLDIHGDGIIEDNNVGLLSGETVYHEVHVNSDGNYIQSANTTAQNLTALDTAVGNIDSTLSDYDLAVKYDTSAKDLLTLSGTSGTKITNLIPATLSETSSDAVIGSQLYTTNQNLATEITNRTNADTSLSNRIGSLSANGHYILKNNTVSQNLAILDSYVYNNTSSGGDSGGVSSTTNHFFGVGSTDASDPNYDGLGASGEGSIAIGVNSRATSMNSIAIGKNVLSGGSYFAETRNIALGTDISTWNKGDGTVSIGNYLQNSGGIVVGIHSTVDSGSVAIGLCSEAYDLSSAIGSYNKATSRQGAAVGVGNEAKGIFNVALGSYSRTSGSYSLAVGHNAYAKSRDSSIPYDISAMGNVAIGNYSSTGNSNELPEDLVFSIGHKVGDAVTDDSTTGYEFNLTRRIINVTDGKSATDAATVGQTIELSNGLNSVAEVQEDANAIGQKVVKINVSTNGQVASGNTGIVSGDTVYNAIQDALQDVGGSVDVTNKANVDAENVTDAQAWADKLGIGTINIEDTRLVTGSAVAGETRLATDGNYVLSDKTAGENISILDTSLKALDTIAVKYDGEDMTTATLAGTSGTKLTNLKPATLSASSTDAVIGAQLYAVKQDITGFASDINRNKESIRELNTSVSSALSSVSSTSLLVDTIDGLKADTSLNNLSNAGKQVIATAAVNAVQEYLSANPILGTARPTFSSVPNTLNITDAGNGSLHVGEGSYVNGTSSIAIGVGNQVNANNAGAFGDPSIINADASYVLGNDDTVNTGAVSSFIIGNDSVSNAEGSLLMGSRITSTGKNGMALGNDSRVSAENAIALGYGSVADEINTLSVGNSTLKRRITNVADGQLTETSSDAVTGQQLYATNSRIEKAEKALGNKADTDASNIDVTKWAEKLGTGKVEEGNEELVTGDTVYHAVSAATMTALDAFPVKTDGENIFIGADMGGDMISVANSKGDGRVITGVATNPNDMSSATNVGYVNAVGENIMASVNNSLHEADTKMNKIGANAAALASLTPASFEGDERWSLAAAVGHYKGQTAGAVGAFYKPAENIMMNVRGAVGNGENMIGAGVAVSLNKGDVPGVTKRQLFKEVTTLKQEREQDRQQIAQQSREIQQLRAMVQQLAENQNRLQNQHEKIGN